MISCTNCKYSASVKGNTKPYYECRRYAPRGGGGDAFSVVLPSDWCGDFKPKEASVTHGG